MKTLQGLSVSGKHKGWCHPSYPIGEKLQASQESGKDELTKPSMQDTTYPSVDISHLLKLAEN